MVLKTKFQNMHVPISGKSKNRCDIIIYP